MVTPRGGQQPVSGIGLDRALLAPRVLIFLLLAVIGISEPDAGHVHWLVLIGYGAATAGLALRHRGRPLSQRLGWVATLLDAALALFLLGEHSLLLQAGHIPTPGGNVANQLPAFLFLLQSGLTLDLRRIVVLAGLIAAGWCGLLVAVAGNTTALGHQIYGLLAFVVAALFVVDGVQRLQTSVDDAIRAEAERARLARFLPFEATGLSGLGAANSTRYRHAVMLAVDVRAFSAMTRQHGAAAVVPWLLDVRAIVHQAVTQHGGFVDKYLGDGILAHFLEGSPESQARAALAAASALQDRLFTWNRDRFLEGLPPLRVSTVMHAGGVLAGVFDDGQRSEFTVLGPAMNALSRIERRAKDDGLDLLVSKRFARLLDRTVLGNFRCSRLARRSDDRDAPDMIRLDRVDTAVALHASA